MPTFRIAIAGMLGLALVATFDAAASAQSDGEDASRPPIPSAGCGASDVMAGDLSRQIIEVGGIERTFSARVPEAHDGTTPVPLWVYLHGSYGSMSEGIRLVGRVADEHGFILASPQGRGKWNRGADDTELDLSLANPDIAFIDALIDHLGSRLCIDLARVYAAGSSNGGEAVNVLACVLEDRLAATGAAASGPVDLGDDCDLSRPVPFLYIHGAADSSRPLEGGLTGQPIKDLYGAERPIADRIGSMAVRNGCAPEPVVEEISEGVERLSWTCSAEGEVGLVIIDGLGHTWPQASWASARGVDAGQMLWEFFEQHPMPE